MSENSSPELQYLEPKVDVEHRDDGNLVLSSPHPLGQGVAQLGLYLRHWAEAAPDRTFLAERNTDPNGGAWRKVSFGAARSQADAISKALLDRDLGPERPLMILSGNSLKQALLTLGAMQVGIPVAPVSPAYSLMSQDFAKLRHIFDLVCPALIYVEDAAPFAGALESLDLDGVEVLDGCGTAFQDLLATTADARVETAFAGQGPDSVAKYLFTSGSTGLPKGVINTQGMLCSNMQQLQQIWPFLLEQPPVLVDWLPWNHTFGGNIVFNNAMANGGTLYIDGGKPAPGLIDMTADNLRRASPSLYYNVPAGFAALLPFLETDEALRDNFFRDLRLIFYAGAALPQDLWRRMETVSMQSLGRAVPMVSAWGSTETAPMATSVHWAIDRAGVIGLPVPGTEIKMVPNGGKMELRVRGPNVTPGYLKRPDLTAEAFDGEGFYCIGDAGLFADPENPVKGLVFDGRVAEDFKLTTGTWVNSGGLRLAALGAAAPVLQDVVVAGHDRDFVSLLAWPNLVGCQSLSGESDLDAEGAVSSEAVRQHIRDGLGTYNNANPASSTHISRLLLLAEPPAIDANEITDKGYINQRAVLENRGGEVGRLYAETPDADIIVL
ncbi:MAG: feruloyl-CoA synthase [Alphaproteobacteria bacterium]|jgi:feruloyl-CoA synthase|nr:feruloyl-CoA synthase [Alphaproteobacteria bacterium]MDP6255822.1 feruloyl-CoA synthase [Alphaproteobacteria bacterium]MDP7227444.1 feruloyl-CoA synthase [Alphaproteobacteria bacterium]HJM92239.1 feruloyl-CoA synthase [Alphaproteobacteria bacterium]|tara:strand:- start:2797 stop:4623 length:1827 start_codon:yes stop_codon:yes gene_type:complete